MTAISLQQESSATLIDLSILGNEDYDDAINRPERWTPRMRKTLGFDSVAQARFQKYIDRITGLSHGGHSIIKLEWGPDVLGWHPYAHGSDPIGYTHPTWLALWNSASEPIAAPRWVLHERIEPEQYLPSWEDGRWVWFDTPNRVVLYDDAGNPINEKGKLHDVKGDPPLNGYYAPWHCHAVHRDGCCRRPENRNACWGFYVEPNETLLEFIGRHAWAARNDREVDPTSPVELLPENRSGNNKVQEHLEAQIVNPEINATPQLAYSPVERAIG